MILESISLRIIFNKIQGMKFVDRVLHNIHYAMNHVTESADHQSLQ